MAGKWWLAGLIACGLLAGCERNAGGDEATPPSTSPATTHASTLRAATTTRAAATSPVVTLSIEGATNAFPQALMRLDEVNDQITALLYTDDPEAALRDDYQGNSFYFELALDITAPGDITVATYELKAESQERTESPEGIFLNGRRWHVQPDDIHITFRPEPGTPDPEVGDAPRAVEVHMTGNFRMFDTTSERTTSTVVPVDGTFKARVLNKTR